MDTRTTRRSPRSSPYWPVVTHPVLRRILPGFAVSYLGSGMSAVAVSWLAIQLAPAGQRGMLVAVALAAATLPGAAGGLLFGRLLRGRGGAQLAGWDATLQAVALGAIPLLAVFGALTMTAYVALLGAASLLSVWGGAGRYTLLAQVLPARDHLAANALVGTLSELGTILGPMMAALIVAHANAATVIAVDAATFAVLAVTYRFAVPRDGARPESRRADRGVGFRIIMANPRLLGLIGLTFGFFLLYGPVEVALPLYVVTVQHASAGMLAAYWTVFGVGAVLGGIVAGHLGRWRMWPTTIGIVLGWGLALLPLGLGAPTWLALAAFGVGGLIYAPYNSTSMALFQRTVEPDRLPQVLAARGVATVLSFPAGTLLAGPLVAVVGPRITLLVSALTTICLAVLAATGVATRARRARRSAAQPPRPTTGGDAARSGP